MATNLHLLLELGFRFNPSPEEVVTYYLPRLIAGHPPKDTESCIHRVNVYGAEPRDLAAQFAPVARSSNGDRFFLTECRRIKGKVSRVAGGGSWVSQTSKDIKNREGIKVGEAKNFRFKKDGKNTDWLMEEYHLCLREAGDLEPVLCRMYVSPRAAKDSAARQESAALPRQEPARPLAPAPAPAAIQEPAALTRQELASPLGPPPAAPAPPRREAVITQQQAPLKWPTPAQVSEPQCAKKMRGSVPASQVARQSCVTASAPPQRRVAPQPAPPSSLRPAPSAVAPPRQVPVITQQQAPPLKRPAPPVPSPPCAKKIRGVVSASPVARQSCVAVSAPPLRPAPPSRRVMAPPPPYPMDPFETPPSPHAPRDPFEPPPSPDPPIQSYAMDPFEPPPSPYAPHDDDDMDEFMKSLEAQLEEDNGDEIAAAPVAPPVAQTVAPDDDGDMDEFTGSLEAQLEEDDGDDKPQKTLDVTNDSEGDDMDELARSVEEGLLSHSAEDIFAELDKIDGDQIDEEIFQIPLKDYGDKLFF
uniref:NAC domain-containing protein n=1 Tax=Oryza punctata TaxID=4537 RepID=A0A0E0MLQ5_ORYPU